MRGRMNDAKSYSAPFALDVQRAISNYIPLRIESFSSDSTLWRTTNFHATRCGAN